MFCPQCKAEYRQGFTHCADCDVDLVWELPKEGLVAYSPPSPGDPDKDPYCSFWKGDDPRLHTELCQLLDEEGIPHKTVRRADHLFHISKYPAFQIGVPFSLFDRAEAAVKEAYGTEEEQPDAAALLPQGNTAPQGSRSIRAWIPEKGGVVWSKKETEEAGRESPSTPMPEELTAKDEEAVSRSDWDPDNWCPEDAVVEVWSGGSPEFAELLASSLRENEIHSRQKQTADKLLLLVLPQDESRAREIVHEVVDGIPPQ